MGSAKKITPTKKAPTAPMPVQIVYAVPRGIDRMAIASKPKLATIATSVTRDGTKRVKPCDCFIVKAHTISRNPAIKR